MGSEMCIRDRYMLLMQIASLLAAKCGDAQAMAQIQQLAQESGGTLPPTAMDGISSMPSEDGRGTEHSRVRSARAQTREAAMPDGGAM